MYFSRDDAEEKSTTCLKKRKLEGFSLASPRMFIWWGQQIRGRIVGFLNTGRRMISCSFVKRLPVILSVRGGGIGRPRLGFKGGGVGGGGKSSNWGRFFTGYTMFINRAGNPLYPGRQGSIPLKTFFKQ